MATKKQFLDFLKDIEPSPTTKSEASSAHIALRKFLRNHEEFKKVHLNTFLSGSYKRATAIRPRIINNKLLKPDIDIMVVTNYSLFDSPEEVIKFLRTSLKDNDYNFVQPPNTRSVGIYTDKVDMDVVPIIAPYGIGSTLYIPDIKLNEWLITSPPTHTKWTEEVNEESGGRFKPLVKLFKWWRREKPTISKRPKGFVIECIVAECMDYNEDSYEELFLITLDNIVKKYAGNIIFKTIPFIEDPAVQGNSVAQGMTFEAFEGFYNKAKLCAELGRQAQQENDPEKELKLWRKIFGQRFPAAKINKSEGLLEAALTPSALKFPNEPVRPKKPAGFA